MIHSVILYLLPSSQQACQLGQHRSICKSQPEGILKVGTTEGRSMTEQPLSDWFLKMAARDGNNEVFNKLKAFAQVCRYDLGNMFMMLKPKVHMVCTNDDHLLFILWPLPAPYLSEQSLDSSLLSQRSPTVASSLSSQTSSSTSSGPQSTNTTSSSTSSAQSAQINSTPPSSSSGSQNIGGMASAKPSSYSMFATAGLQGSTSQNGPQSNSQGAGGLAENGSLANQSQAPAETPER